MTGQRLVVAHVMICLMLVGSLVCIITDREVWPFSNYPMYSWLSSDRFTYKLLYGITAEGEMPLSSRRYWSPLDGGRLNIAFSRMEQSDDAERRTAIAADFLARRYEQRRAQQRHHGPPIHGLRVYECTWTLRPWAVNRDHPDQRRLLVEIRLDGRHGVP